MKAASPYPRRLSPPKVHLVNWEPAETTEAAEIDAAPGVTGEKLLCHLVDPGEPIRWLEVVSPGIVSTYHSNCTCHLCDRETMHLVLLPTAYTGDGKMTGLAWNEPRSNCDYPAVSECRIQQRRLHPPPHVYHMHRQRSSRHYLLSPRPDQTAPHQSRHRLDPRRRRRNCIGGLCVPQRRDLRPVEREHLRNRRGLTGLRAFPVRELRFPLRREERRHVEGRGTNCPGSAAGNGGPCLEEHG